MSRTVGWFTTLYPLCLSVAEDFGETLARIRATIRAFPHNGLGYGAIHGYAALPKVLFNYLEKLDGIAEDRWPIRFGEASGESMSPENRFGNRVEINGLTVGGKIRLGLESYLDGQDHLLLCDAFKRNLEAVALFYPLQAHGRVGPGQG